MLDKQKTRVKFIWFHGNIIALFPDDLYNPDLYYNRLISSYQHIGQHGAADKSLMRYKRAKPHEYHALQDELTQIGYNLTII